MAVPFYNRKSSRDLQTEVTRLLTTKEKILGLLEENRGHILSGTAIAKSLDLSRAAVWKAIEELRKEGYTIDAVTNKGYSLPEGSDLLSVEGILLHLADLPIQREQIHVYKSIDSTNQLGKRMAVDGAPHGSIFLAEEQTDGRGRRGRSFFSPKGKGLYMSILLRPTGTAEEAVLTTTAAGVAVCRALSKTFNMETSIKWVNDIFYNGRKICGIMTEAVSGFESGAIEFLVLGIGVNVSTVEEEFPPEIRTIAGSLLSGSGNSASMFSRNALAAAILREVLAIAANPSAEEFIDEYRSRCFILGHKITVLCGDSSYPATAIDIDGRGALIIEKEDGTTEILNSGEVSIRPES